MKEDFLKCLAVVLNALDNITVQGRQNLANLSGSIAILEEMRNNLLECEITQRKKEEKKE